MLKNSNMQDEETFIAASENNNIKFRHFAKEDKKENNSYLRWKLLQQADTKAASLDSSEVRNAVSSSPDTSSPKKMLGSSYSGSSSIKNLLNSNSKPNILSNQKYTYDRKVDRVKENSTPQTLRDKVADTPRASLLSSSQDSVAKKADKPSLLSSVLQRGSRKQAAAAALAQASAPQSNQTAAPAPTPTQSRSEHSNGHQSLLNQVSRVNPAAALLRNSVPLRPNPGAMQMNPQAMGGVMPPPYMGGYQQMPYPYVVPQVMPGYQQMPVMAVPMNVSQVPLGCYQMPSAQQTSPAVAPQAAAQNPASGKYTGLFNNNVSSSSDDQMNSSESLFDIFRRLDK
ncbi:MAG: hypothetical protein J5934_05230 [Succinivibrio sp.]|nr:hypothetical protein [Succinivibrio sp.]